MKLPAMKYGGSVLAEAQTVFGGYDHRLGAGDGSLYDMTNLTGAEYPLMAVRPERYRLKTLAAPGGLYARDALCWVDGTGFHYNGVLKGTVTAGRKVFASLGAYLLIFPDKKYYHAGTDLFGSLEAFETAAATFQDGTIYGETAAGNTLYSEAVEWPFSPGDGVTISGCETNPENNKCLVVREVSEDRHSLRFYENSFLTGAETAVTVCRSVPDLDFLCENSNRVWGCKGDTLYCSKLGDPFNWNVFDGLATDSWAVSVGSAGDFTGCASYLGYPVFFKENMVYKVYGSLPSNFEFTPSARLGVAAGCGNSLAVAGETLYYLSRAGVTAYTGGVPAVVSAPLGEVRYGGAVGGSDGLRYYVSMRDEDGAWSLFVYDTQRRLWHREDDSEAVGFAQHGGVLYMLAAAGGIWAVGQPGAVPENGTAEGPVSWEAEFGDFEDGSPDKKGVSRFRLRCGLAAGASLSVLVQYDSGGRWETLGSVSAGAKRTVLLPVVPRRADHYRLKLSGVGGCRVYGLTRERYTGSER